MLALCSLSAQKIENDAITTDTPRLNLPPAKAVKYNWKNAVIPAALSFASGMAWGFHETSVHHPSRYPDTWNRRFWDNSVSWTNKYRAGDPAQGEAFLGSTTFLAWTTDAKHLFGTVHRGTLFAAGVTLTIGQKRPWWHYIADAGISYAAFATGFHSIYSITF
jgi:hypothetical protein